MNTRLRLRLSQSLVLGLAAFIVVTAKTSPLYFTSNRSGNWDIFRFVPGGRDTTQLTATLWDEKDISLSADGTKLVFVGSDGFIRIADTEPFAVTDSIPRVNEQESFCNPTLYDSTVLFSTLIDIERDFSVIRQRKGGEVFPFITKRASVFFPEPIGTTGDILYTYRICLVDCGTFVSEIWHFDAGKRLNKQMTLESSFIIDLCAADSVCYFASNKRGTMDIYRLGLADKSVSFVVGTSAQEVQPALSADKKQLAYIKRDRGKTHIIVRDLATGKEEDVTPTQSRILNLAW